MQLRHQADAVLSYDPGRFLSVLVILEALLDQQSCHADVNAWLSRLAIRVQTQDRWMPKHGWVEEDHVNAVVKGLAAR